MKVPYDISNYKLTLPVNAVGDPSGSAAQVLPADLISGYESTYFRQPDDGTFVFICPDGGATTPGTSCARSELRDLRDFTFKQERIDNLNFMVEQLPDGQEVIVHQFHDDAEPVGFLGFTAGANGKSCFIKLYAHPVDGGSHTSIIVLSGLSLGDKITSRLEYLPISGGQILKAIVNGKAVQLPLQRKGKGGNIYPKRGAYYQSSAHAGHRCEVIHF